MIARTFLLAACFFLFIQEALALPSTVRVRLFSAAGSSEPISISPPFRIVSPHAQVVQGSALWYVDKVGGQVQISPQNTKRTAGIAGSAIVVAPLYRVFTVNCGKSSRKVPGVLTFSLKNGALSTVLKVPTKDYVCGVVGSESLPEFAPEALKAQAVLVDTWLAHRKAGEIIGDDTSDMAYLGADYARLPVIAAVDKTFPQVLVDKIDGHVIKAFFHSTCAGKLSLAEEVFNGRRALASKAKDSASPATCNFCRKSPFFNELHNKLPVSAVRAKLGFEILQIVQTDSAGRPLVVSIERGGGKKEISGYQLWLKVGQNFGWGILPGMSYTIERVGDYYSLTSRGAGHGIGLCQWGAQGMSQSPHKKDYKQILGYYFPQARIANGRDRETKRNE